MTVAVPPAPAAGATSAAPQAQQRQSTARFCSPHCVQVFRKIWLIGTDVSDTKAIRSDGQQPASL
jgi:hypothetical protein